MVGTGDCFKDKLEDPAHKIFFTQPLHGPLEKREEAAFRHGGFQIELSTMGCDWAKA